MEKQYPDCPFCTSSAVVPNEGCFHCNNCGGDFDTEGKAVPMVDEFYATLDSRDVRNNYLLPRGGIDSNRLAQDINRLLSLMLKALDAEGWNVDLSYRQASETITEHLASIYNPPAFEDR
jgi:hypothetical protein